ncbi:LysR family transcriptional regulator [Nonomuraea gerenzanensis]|uniref:Transcriptional regulator, LysR family n=1 Tax=Nonomuraea gerenzanensis TaxID=93944 RepID=A0A1M4E4T2_9ACTN|nr:LysR family transcriptional regulator [Nonomuraea gerenzanensis]UBU15984.1 LysR family transcriptional regulator [Nonomuraea gerenzanensis]SBO93782.1 transcriptional regulator, LysR family [Nonomuraea gerenzanensis]
MNLQQLRYAVALAEELNFGRAALREGVRQPPFSQQIGKLEEELGVRLFERTTRQVRLTAAGEAFVAEARTSLAHAELAAEAARRAGRGEAGRLAIGFVGSATNLTLPRVLRRFRARYPGVQVELRELTTAQQAEELRQGLLDVGLLHAPLAGPAAEVLSTRTVARELLLAALPTGHPLAGRTPLPASALAGEAFVLFPRRYGSGLYDQIMAVARAAGFEPVVVQEAVQMQTIVGLVAAGIGVSVVPESVARLRRGDVVFRPLSPATRVVTLDVTWRTGDPNPVVRNFRDLFPAT